MGKTALILAPIIVGAVVLWFTFWMGRFFERVRRDVQASHISPRVHADLVELVRDLLNPTDLTDVPYLPPVLRQRAELTLKNANENAASVRRAERRRAGY